MKETASSELEKWLADTQQALLESHRLEKLVILFKNNNKTSFCAPKP